MALKKCDLCDRRFSKAEHLKRHERAHTRERPYKCMTCNKSFSRSDVLYRHSKGHAPKNPQADPSSTLSQPGADNIQKDSTYKQLHEIHGGEDVTSMIPQDQIGVALPGLVGAQISTQTHSGNSQRFDVSPTILTQPPTTSSEHQNNSNTNIASDETHKAATTGGRWYSSPPRPPTQNDDQFMECTQTSIHTTGSVNEVSPINPAIACMTPDAWLDFSQSINPTPDFTSPRHNELLKGIPSDALQMWVFQENNLFIQPTSFEVTMENSTRSALGAGFSRTEEDQPSPAGTSSSIASQISRCQLSRVEKYWQAPSVLSTRHMTILWKELISSRSDNLYCYSDCAVAPRSPRRLLHSQWGFDEECLNRLKDALNVMPLPNHHDRQIQGQRRAPYQTDDSRHRPICDIVFPPAEIFELALEMYFVHFHPTLPLIHPPTFSIKHAPPPLLLVMCLLGFNILGTSGARGFVSQIFPNALNLVSFELQAATQGPRGQIRQLSALTTALLMIHIASISGYKDKILQTEILYMNLISAAQYHGLFSSYGSRPLHDLIEGIADIDQRWKAWARIESVNHLIIGLLEIDCWFADYLSSSPLIRPEIIQIIPPSSTTLFNANSASQWTRLASNGRRIFQETINPAISLKPIEKVDPDSVYSTLTLFRLRIHEAQYHLIALVEQDMALLEPWRAYAVDSRSSNLVPLIAGLACPGVDVLNRDLNSVISWHTLCMMLGANLKTFELAAGRSGVDSAQVALEEIAAWSRTAAARRSCIHAAHIFKLLLHRRVRDTVTMHSVLSLFQSALILSFFTLTMPQDQSDDEKDCFELYDEVDWAGVGSAGLAENSGHMGSITTGKDFPALDFICNGGPVSIDGCKVEGGYEAARRSMVHCADLMDGIGRWKSRSFSQILHVMGDDLSEFGMDDEMGNNES